MCNPYRYYRGMTQMELVPTAGLVYATRRSVGCVSPFLSYVLLTTILDRSISLAVNNVPSFIASRAVRLTGPRRTIPSSQVFDRFTPPCWMNKTPACFLLYQSRYSPPPSGTRYGGGAPFFFLLQGSWLDKLLARLTLKTGFEQTKSAIR